MLEAFPMGGASSLEDQAAPEESDPGTIITREEAEIHVRKIRNGFWADMRPGDRRIANAHARMAIADVAFEILGREDLDPTQIVRSTYLLIDARDRLIHSTYGHFGRAQDLWADKVAEVVRIRLLSSQKPNE